MMGKPVSHSINREAPLLRRLSWAGLVALRPWKPELMGSSMATWAPPHIFGRMVERRGIFDVSQFSRQALVGKLQGLASLGMGLAAGAAVSSLARQTASRERWSTRYSAVLRGPGAAWQRQIASYTISPAYGHVARVDEPVVDASSRRGGLRSRSNTHASATSAAVTSASPISSRLPIFFRRVDPMAALGKRTTSRGAIRGTALSVAGVIEHSKAGRPLLPADESVAVREGKRWAPTNPASAPRNRQTYSELLPAVVQPNGHLSAVAAGWHGAADVGISESAPTVTAGELILDGAELGSWVIRHLADSLAVAPMGTTGPDGRIAPPAPGTALYS